MAGKKDKSKSRLTRKDTELWKTVTKDVRRLPGRDYEEPDEEAATTSARSAAVRERVNVSPKAATKKAAKGTDVDRSTAQKFTRGKMEIEGTIDLHGMGQAEAREALRKFIKGSHSRGRRCVLVITGKGLLNRPAVLKARVPEWLSEEPLAPLILKTARAQIRHGGEGALYVLLRRSR